MFTAGRALQAISAVTTLLAFAAGATRARAQSPSEIRSATRSLRLCRETDPIRLMRSPVEQLDRLAASDTLLAGELCNDSGVGEPSAAVIHKEDGPPILLRPDDTPIGSPGLTPRLHDLPSIRASGKEAAAIARSSAAVLAILRNNNPCSAWFAKADAHVADTFSSLSFWIERDGPEHIIQERTERGDWIEHGPYIARTSEGSGPGTNVGINRNGAFFRARAEVYKIEWQRGYELPTNNWQFLHVGPFEGATAQAQIITLLHELAHVVGAIPADGMSPSGLYRSQENTDLILKQCKGAVNSSANHPAIELAQKLPY